MKSPDTNHKREKTYSRSLKLALGIVILTTTVVLFSLFRPSESHDKPEISEPSEQPSISSNEEVDGPIEITEMISRDDVPGLPPVKIAPFPLRPLRQVQPHKPGAFLAGPSNKSAVDRILEFLSENREDSNLTPLDIDAPIIRNQHSSKHNGVTHVYLRQQHRGIEVYNGDLNANVAKDGSLINLNHRFVSNLESGIDRIEPVLSAQVAIASAADALKLRSDFLLKVKEDRNGPAQEKVFEKIPGLSRDDIPAKLMFLPLENEEIRLVWNTVLHLEDGKRWLDLNVDAETGEVLSEANWVASASYEAFPLPFESPSDGTRSVLVDPQDSTASPFGWHDTNGVAGAEFTDTRGNNVNAQDDIDANDSGGTRPDGGAGLTFSSPLDLTDSPPDYLDASISNMFYWNNICHDVFYYYGFDEAAGNFQFNNYGNGGSGGDPVEADAQDGEDFNNANFGTPPDGFSPRMQMFQWTYTIPFRDSALDSGVIVHEYGHGISNRLTGGSANSSALASTQSGGMGEGWSDFFALCLTAIPSDAADTPRGIGTYLIGQSPTGNGIRPARYTTDTGVNDFTFGELAEETLYVPHGVGFVWCTILWEIYWELVDEHGYDPDLYGGTGGNNLALQLVVDGLKLQPSNPTFTEARDAIILADQINNSGANFGTLWNAFASRGLGASAYDGGGPESLDVIEAFDIPDDLTVTPGGRVTSRGEIGGPFDPLSRDFTLTNDGGSSINWSASFVEPWLNLSSTSGSLNAGQSVVVTATVNAGANSLPAGVFDAEINFINSTSGAELPREFRLIVTGTANLITGPGFDDASGFTGFFHIPANPHGAAGKHSLLATANNFLDLRTKDGFVIDQKSLAGFFQGEADPFPSDCRIYWDPHEDRYIVCALDRDDTSQTSQFLVAVSKDDNPQSLSPDQWHIATIDSKLNFDSEDRFAFFPKFGFDEEAIYVFAYNYAFSDYSFGGTRLWIVDKGASTGGLYQGGAAASTVHDPFESAGIEVTCLPARVQGVSGVGSNIGTFLVGYDGLNNGTENFIQLIRVNDPLGSVSFTQEYYNLGEVEPIGAATPEVPQGGTPTEPGVRTALDGGFGEVTDAVWRNGELWMTTMMVSAAGADNGELATRWIKVDTSPMTSTSIAMTSITIEDQGNITGEDIAPGTHTFYPSVAVNDEGDAKFAFCASGPNLFAGAYVAGRKASDPPGTVRAAEVIKEGEDFYTRSFQSDPTASTNENSWGDVSAIIVDPEDEDYFWSFNAYAMTRGTAFSNEGGPIEDGRWGTAWGLCTFRRDLIINEVDSLTLDGDTREFIEIYDGGMGNTSLNGFAIVLFDGATDTSYAAFDLDGHTTDANGYFVVGNAAVPNAEYIIPDGIIQNGADAVALYQADASQFSTGTPIDVSGELLDAVVYDSGQADDPALLNLLNASEPQLNENLESNASGHSLQRLPNGSGGLRNTVAFSPASPTPGLANSLPPAPENLDLTDGSDSGTSNSDNLTNDTSPTFTGTARPGSVVTLIADVDIDLDSQFGAADPIGVTVADSNGNWSVTEPMVMVNSSATFTATADGSPESAPLTVTFDTIAPTSPSAPDLSSTSDSGISNSDNITNLTALSLTGAAPTGTLVSLKRVNSPLDGVVLQGPSDGSWSFSIGSTPVGTYDFVATSTDDAGNESPPGSPLEVTVDTTSPTLTIEKSAGQLDPASSTQVQFDAIASESAYGFINSDVDFLGTLGGTISLTGGPANFTITLNISGGEGTTGAFVPADRFTDAAGNQNVASTSSDSIVQLDTHGGDSGSATALTFSNDSSSVFGWVEAGDSDFFSFTLAAPKAVEIYTTGQANTRGVLFDSDDTILNDPEADKDAGQDDNFSTSDILPAGTYFVGVTKEGAASQGSYTLHIDISEPPLMINEVDADTSSFNTFEFIELYDNGVGNKPLDDYVLVFYRGDTEESYLALDLDTFTTDADGFFVVGNALVPNVDLVIPDQTIRNGRDGVALYTGSAAQFPNGTPVTDSQLEDAVVCLPDAGTSNAQLSLLLLAGQLQIDEGANGYRGIQSLQRLPDGAGGPRVTANFDAIAPTPGSPNELPPAPGVPNLPADSDSGDSASDDLTNIVRPRIIGPARYGTLVELTSNRDGFIGLAPCYVDGTYVLDGTDFDLSEGTHVITPTTTSTGEPGPTLTIEVDTTPPASPTGLDLTTDSGSSAVDDITNDNTPTFQGLAVSGSTVELYADGVLHGGATGNGSTPWSVTVSGASPLIDATHAITATATDPAGNISSASSALNVTIDTIAPTLNFGKAVAQADPATAGPVEFTAAFNEDVAGFTNGDITTGGTSAGAVAITDGPDVYTVSISALSTEGTISASVAAGAADDIAGNASIAPTFGDTSVTLDSHGSDSGSATSLTFSNDSASDAGWIDPADTDGFSFTLTEPRIVTVQTSGSTDTRGLLVSVSGGGTLHDPEEDKNAGAGNNFLISEALPPGSYVVFVTGEGTANTGDYSLSIDTAPIPMLINEVDADTGADHLEFVELFDGGAGNTSLDGMVLVFYRGDTEESYLAVDLDGESTDADGYFVAGNVGVSNVDLDLPDDSLRNDRSAAALYFGDDTDFPNGTALQSADLLDALVSLPDGGSKTAQLDSLLLPAQPHFDESANGFRAGQSIQRIPDGSGGARITEDYVVAAPTPGAANGLPAAPGAPDLDDASDSGSSNIDDLTNIVRPAFRGFAAPGSQIRLSSDRAGSLGIAQTAANGIFLLASTGVDLAEGTHVITPTTVSTGENGPTLSIEIDTTAPGIPTGLDLEDTSDSGDSDTDNITNDDTPTFTGDAETGSTVQLFADATPVGTTTANSPWSITSSLLADEDYDITVTATDVAGNTSLASTPLGITIDTTAPDVSITLATGQTATALDGPAVYTATFSETILGFEIADVVVTGTAAGAASLSGGSPAFDISVETTVVEGSVIVSIPASIAQDTAGNLNEAATSIGNRVNLDRDDAPSGEPTDVPPGSGPLASYLSPDDIDSFTFTIAALSYVTVQTLGSIDTLGEIRDSSHALLNDPDTDDDLGEDENFLAFLTLGPGTYTAVVSAKDSQEGDFELTVEATLVPPAPVINNNLVLKSQLSRKIEKLKKKIKKVKKKGNNSKAKKLKGKLKKLVKQLKSL